MLTDSFPTIRLVEVSSDKASTTRRNKTTPPRECHLSRASADGEVVTPVYFVCPCNYDASGSRWFHTLINRAHEEKGAADCLKATDNETINVSREEESKTEVGAAGQHELQRISFGRNSVAPSEAEKL
jgi:hypothetical protein